MFTRIVGICRVQLVGLLEHDQSQAFEVMLPSNAYVPTLCLWPWCMYEYSHVRVTYEETLSFRSLGDEQGPLNQQPKAKLPLPA